MLVKNGSTPTIVFVMVQSSDHLTPGTGLTVTANISKAGGVFAATTNAVTEIANGFYKVALTATETNTNGLIGFHCTATGADPTQFLHEVVAIDTTDAAALGLSRLDAAVSSRMATFTLPTNFSALAITAGGAVTVGTNNDKTGYSISGTKTTLDALNDITASAVWSVAVPGAFGAGTAGNVLGNNLNAAVSSRMATFSLPTNFASMAITVGGAVTVGTNNDKTGYSISGTKTTLDALNDIAASAVWSVTVPGAFAAGTAGLILGTNLNATVSSRAQPGDAMALTTGERNSVADALLDRADAIETGATPRGILRLMGAALAGLVSGAGTGTEVFKNAVAGAKPRITATVDANGNRTAITYDQT